MLYEKVCLDPENPHVCLEVYAAESVGSYVRSAILIIPGGGYATCCADREGEPIAHAFLPHGFNAFVLHYSTTANSGRTFPAQLIEASKAMRHIRQNAERYHIDPDRVFVCGFSAGGHLAASLGTMWHLPEVTAEVPEGINKPTGMMLIYPVISGKYHLFSLHNLLGSSEPTGEQLAMCSIENHVDSRSVPAFVMQTFNDELVDVRNALTLAQAYKEANLSMELHIYPDAPHGVALGNAITSCGNSKWENPAVAQWVSSAAFWANNV